MKQRGEEEELVSYVREVCYSRGEAHLFIIDHQARKWHHTESWWMSSTVQVQAEDQSPDLEKTVKREDCVAALK